MDTLTLLLAALSIYLFTHFFSSYKRASPRPPGPRPLPIIGNLLDIPRENEWIVYAEWARKWGNLIMVGALGRNILVVNDADLATELLDRHSLTTSDRPTSTMSHLSGWANMLVEKDLGDPSFKVQRKMIHKLIGTPSVAKQYDYLQEQETQKLLRMIFKDKGGKSGELMAHIKAATTAVVLRLGYGYQVKDTHDEYVRRIERMTDAFIVGSQTHSFLVNMFPVLNRLPSWFPGTGFKKMAEKYRKEYFEAIEPPFEFAKQQTSSQNNEVSMTVRLLEEPEGHDKKIWEENVKYAMGILYSGGSETTGISIYAFFKAMILYPEVQRRAQAEIDALTGGHRLPDSNDRQNLPYLNAIVTEVLRWHPVGPLGQPHAASTDMIFKGYSIPKDTVLIANVWAMCYDPNSYRDPAAFNPDRFLPTDGSAPERDPRAFVFGYGRRTLPRRNGIFLGCAMSLAVFDILPALDERGNPVLPDVKTASGLVSHPSPFEYTIKPRSKACVEMITGTAN